MDSIPLSIIIILASYLSGSIPTAYLVVKLFYGKNIYLLGSGNGGATNVFRETGKIPGLIVFLLDFSKGFFPLLWGVKSEWDTALILLMATAVLTGHAFPVWTGFKGGKGVAVSAGAISAIFPLAAPFCAAAFGLTLLATRYVSLSSLAAAFTLPGVNILSHIINRQDDFWLRESFFVILFLLVLFFHRSNIARLIRGEEKKAYHAKPERDAQSPERGK